MKVGVKVHQEKDEMLAVSGSHGYYPPDWSDKEGFTLNVTPLRRGEAVSRDLAVIFCGYLSEDTNYLKLWVLPHLREIVARLELIAEQGWHGEHVQEAPAGDESVDAVVDQIFACLADKAKGK